ncbi:hypothetical protein F2P56_024801 [Juglans regia]|uniref:Homeobox domain-containing protein n=1 Tax=Juglans regia TaxID=51240 RepID=A0A833X0T3_JUGRE|nr:hypothetical protein F2P56_024801 [Juglans regia]
MEVLKDEFSELEIGSSVDSFQRFMDSQRELFHSQIDQLQNIVVTQCKLTGVNPLSQEMAAGALSIKIGKRPRDLLNPKAVKYMQSVFSIKDAISKKESREISALFGVTVTQVRDFFNSQRSRVRKLVRLSREKAMRSGACKEPHDGALISSDPTIPIDLVPLDSVGPASVEEAPSCSTQDDALPGLDDEEKHFVENIFILMRKEETFSGQVKLMEWILQIQNSSVLCWFLSKGGVMILATWLSQAAVEEQTSVLLVILKVLCHMPLHKALPVHMSAILQSVNRLRFYRTSDISNRARVLLSRWSKLLARSQALKKPNGMKSASDIHNDIMLKQSIEDIVGEESWHSSIDIPEDILAPPYGNLEHSRKLESPQALKLLPASSDDSNRKQILGVSSSQSRERRKVQMVEQPVQKMGGRSQQATRAAPVSRGRPMSADDIQKAKMRALFMQSKYGKTGSSNDSKEAKTEGLNKPSNTQPNTSNPVSKVALWPKTEEEKKPVVHPLKNSKRSETPLDTMLKMNSKEPLWELCGRVQIPWQMPPEMIHDDVWRVGAGENSKEVEVQKNRNRREKETIYQTVLEIPSNPKEPWDIEIDYDDTLTPEIPTEQLPDADSSEPQVASNQDVNNAVSLEPTSSQVGNASTAEPDLELLAVLLKNPELVYALTSGQAGNLSDEQTVKLLDMIKAGGAGFNMLGGKAEEQVQVSLPSPTPSSNPGTSGWGAEVAKNPFSQQTSMANRAAYTSQGLATTGLVFSQATTSNLVQPQQQPARMATYSLPQTTTTIPENQLPSIVHHNRLTNSPILQTPASEVVVTTKNLSAMGASLHNLSTAAVTPNAPASFPSLPLMQTPARPQTVSQSLNPSPLLSEPRIPAAQYSRTPIGKLDPVSDSVWRASQGLPPNYHSQANQNNYNAMVGGSRQPPLQPGPSWERNEYVVGEEFESWSPENSPTRTTDYMSGRNFPEPRTNPGWNYRPDRSRQRNFSGYRDHNRYGDRKWRDRRH